MKLPTTIQGVLQVLDQIIDETVLANNRLGVFAYVYRRTTAEIEKAVQDGRFEDNPRMEAMDVTFANLYIKAYYDYKEGKPVSKSWKASFDAADSGITLVQHLMLGMNAHINLDLGQAAALTAPGNKIGLLKHDFMEVNKVLAELTDVMQKKLGRVSPLMFLLDWIGQRSDEVLVNFSMVKARDQAWNLAEDLARLSGTKREERIQQADENVAMLSNILVNPPGKLLHTATMILGLFEEKNVEKITSKLSRS
jgi:hypothetical protein